MLESASEQTNNERLNQLMDLPRYSPLGPANLEAHWIGSLGFAVRSEGKRQHEREACRQTD